MDFTAPIRGKTVNGVWVPSSALEQKEDRSQSGRFTISGENGRILQGAPSAESRLKDMQSYLEAIKTVPWVFACVSLLAYSFATAPGDLFDPDDNPVEDENDPFLQVWHRPNPYQSGMVFRELLGMFIELAGESYITLEKQDASGIPAELYLPSPARMRVVQDKQSGEVIGYAYDTSGYQNGRYLPSFIPYGVDEVVHIKVANPLNQMRGLGNIEAMETTMDTMIAMTQNELQYWKSGGRITGVLETDQEVDNDTFERLVNRWRMFSADKQARFKTAILEQGLKYTPVAEGFKGLDYSKLDLVKRDFVLANFGVPKNKLGIIEDAQYKSDEADRFFWSETMEPRLSRAEDHFNYGYPRSLVDIFHPEGDYIYRYMRKNFEDDTVKMNNAQMMRNLKVFSQNEIRVYLGQPELPGKAGDSVILQQTDVVVELDKMDEADTAAGAAGGGPPPQLAPDDPKILAARKPTMTPHTHTPGATAQSGQPASVSGNPTSRQAAVDASGHMPDNPTSNTNAGPKANGRPPAQAPEKAFSPEVLSYLDDDERALLMQDYDRQVKAAQEVRRNMRLRGINRRIAKAKTLDRVARYAEKRLAQRIETKEVQSVPAHRPALAHLVMSKGTTVRDGLTAKYTPAFRLALGRVRSSLTPIISKATKIKDPEMRHAFLKANVNLKPVNDVIAGIHAEAANEGWSVGKRTLGVSKRAAVETKDAGDFTSPLLDERYDRALAPNVEGIDDTMMGVIQDEIDFGLERAYSPLQIANGVPDENYAGLSGRMEAYDFERIARTESMFAFNWGAGTALLDSGATEEEALDGIDDPACAERDGTVYEIDPDTGLAVDDSGVPVRDHPNGTLAFIPTGDMTHIIESGALDVEELGAEWEGKAQIIGASAAARYHRHRNGVIHAHDGGHEPHGHRWSKLKAGAPVNSTVVPGPKAADESDVKIVEMLTAATKSLAEIATKYSDAQNRDYHGRWSSGGVGVGGLAGRAAVESHINYMKEQDHTGIALDMLKKNGGFTYDPAGHKFTTVPSEGYGVSPYKPAERVLDQPMTREDIHQYIRDNAELLGRPGHNVGAWHADSGPNIGKDVLDVSIVTPSEDEAHAIARGANQDSIFNFKTGDSIPTRQ